MSHHTPGPWHVSHEQGTENAYLLWDEDDNFYNITELQHVYNAHLMEAAPELLEALKDLLSWHRPKGPGICSIDQLTGFITKAERTIAKAEGRG